MVNYVYCMQEVASVRTNQCVVYGILYSIPEFDDVNIVLRIFDYIHTGIYIYIIISTHKQTVQYNLSNKNIQL